jgi:hypothetical protein
LSLSSRFFGRCFKLIVATTLAVGGFMLAAEPALRDFDLPADVAAKSLKIFAQQAETEILIQAELGREVRTRAVKGRYTPREAIERMLASTGLTVKEDAETRSMAIIPVAKADLSSNASPTTPPGGDASAAKKKSPQTMSRKNSIAALLGWAAVVFGPPASTEAADAGARENPSVQRNDGVAGDVVVISPYTVDTTRDRGYQAQNTLAGTRLNSSLQDTPASVSVITQAFLQDVALDDLAQLSTYSVNSQVYESDTGSTSGNDAVNGQNIVKAIDTRGVRATQALDYFKSITPDDTYRVDRYDDSRGPNSILFGISDAGGLINQTSRLANIRRDSGAIKWSFGTNDRNRAELHLNKGLLDQKVGFSLAVVHQENGGWQLFDYQDKQRFFGALTIKPSSRLTLNVMGETGKERQAIVPPYLPGDGALAWLDNRRALGVAAVTFAPLNANPTVGQQALGVVSRNSTANGSNRRLTYIANNGTLFDAVGTYLTGSYNNAAVRAPDGTPGVTGALIRLNQPDLVPYHANAGGPGMFKEVRLRNYTATADWEIARGLYANFGHNYQNTRLKAAFIPGGNGPTLQGDANTTLGVRGAPNPYVGQLYIDATWKREAHNAERKESRFSLSYDFHAGWFGSHQLAGMVSRSVERDSRVNSWLALAGAPFGGGASGANNRVTTRYYLDPANPATITGGDWRAVPGSLMVDGRAYPVIFANDAPGGNNATAQQKVNTALAVLQSHFWQRRLVTTVGYRVDKAEVTSFGFATDPVVGDVPDYNLAKATINHNRGHTVTEGMVFHVGAGLSVIANASSSIGLPDFIRTIFPNGQIPESSKGRGRDYGLSWDGWDHRLNAKIVYYETGERGKALLNNSTALFTNRNARVADAFESVLVGAGRPVATADWVRTRAALTPAVNGALFDVDSSGYEFSAVANPTPNWRVMANYAYTDRSVAGMYMQDVVPWYGLKSEQGLIQNGVTQDAVGRFAIDPSAFTSSGAIAKWIELSRLSPQANASVLTTATGVTIAQEVYDMIVGINEQKRMEEQRWGLRPHRVNVFTAYDFSREGNLKGVTLGGGFRWRSANIIGADQNGQELKGRATRESDLLLRYSRPMGFSKRARVVFQLNVMNVWNEQGIIPKYLSATPPYIIPGGRGVAYNRFDLIAPRTLRFTTSFEF